MDFKWKELLKKIAKKVLIGINRCFFRIQGLILKISGRDLNLLMTSVCKAVETRKVFVSYQIKPKDTTEIPILKGLNQSHSFAIILQGPICVKDNMTFNTICFYKEVYPNAVIIVSTWDDESEEYMDRLVRLGATVVRNSKPEKSGVLNVNYQLVSSLAGVKKAQEMGCEFAVKTRTDQRVCKPFIFDSMISAINLFPNTSDKQKGRVVALGVCSGGMFIPYHTCDFLYLGYTEDLVQLFSVSLDYRTCNEELRRRFNISTRCQVSRQMLPPEIYILKRYCRDILDISCEDTVKSYWEIVKNNLICYGMNDIDLTWSKYDRLYDMNFYSSRYYGATDSPMRLDTMCFDFHTWLNLYMGNIKYDPDYEKYADVTLFARNDKN